MARPRKKGGDAAITVFPNLLSNLVLAQTRLLQLLKLLLCYPQLRCHFIFVIYNSPGPYTGLLIMGDFNILMNPLTVPLTSAFQTIIDTFGFTQNGNTIDLVLTWGPSTSKVIVLPYTTARSCHYLVKFEVFVQGHHRDHKQSYRSRNISSLTMSYCLWQLLPFLLTRV